MCAFLTNFAIIVLNQLAKLLYIVILYKYILYLNILKNNTL